MHVTSLWNSSLAEKSVRMEWLSEGATLTSYGQVVRDLRPQGELWVALLPAWRMYPSRLSPGEIITEDVNIGVVQADVVDGEYVFPGIQPGDVLRVVNGDEEYEVLESLIYYSCGLVYVSLRRKK